VAPVKIMTRLTFAAVLFSAVAAGLGVLVLGVLAFGVTASRASTYYGDAPWCAVVNQGAGDIVWDCEYQTVAACTPNVLAGNRGFCQLNPYYHPARGPAPRYKHRSHQVGY
jgi:hypothetical protein